MARASPMPEILLQILASVFNACTRLKHGERMASVTQDYDALRVLGQRDDYKGSSVPAEVGSGKHPSHTLPSTWTLSSGESSITSTPQSAHDLARGTQYIQRYRNRE